MNFYGISQGQLDMVFYPFVSVIDLLTGQDRPEWVDDGHAQRLVDVSALLSAARLLRSGFLRIRTGLLQFDLVRVGVIFAPLEDPDQLVHLLQDDWLHWAFTEPLEIKKIISFSFG